MPEICLRSILFQPLDMHLIIFQSSFVPKINVLACLCQTFGLLSNSGCNLLEECPVSSVLPIEHIMWDLHGFSDFIRTVFVPTL